MFSPVRVPLSFVFGLTLFQASCFSVFGWLLSKAFSNPNICPWYLVLTSLYGCETFALLTHWLGHRRIEVCKRRLCILAFWFDPSRPRAVFFVVRGPYDSASRARLSFKEVSFRLLQGELGAVFLLFLLSHEIFLAERTEQ
jgi:hypothetical protein